MNLSEALNHLADTLRSTGDAKAFVLVVGELDRLRGIETRARDMRDTSRDVGDWHVAAEHILGEASATDCRCVGMDEAAGCTHGETA